MTELFKVLGFENKWSKTSGGSNKFRDNRHTIITLTTAFDETENNFLQFLGARNDEDYGARCPAPTFSTLSLFLYEPFYLREFTNYSIATVIDWPS